MTTFQAGSNTWHTYTEWPPKQAKPANLYFHADGTLSFDAPTGAGPAYRQYISDPANPVPYRARPISPTYPLPEWRFWEVADQRFVDHRPDVLTFLSAPLDHDVVVTGEIAATLFASTSGTDSDFIVKLIDVYPEQGQKSAIEANTAYANSMNGYELPIAMEVRRGRYLHSYEQPPPPPFPATPPRSLQPQPSVLNAPTSLTSGVCPCGNWRNRNHRRNDEAFLFTSGVIRLSGVALQPHKATRFMVQVQSTWFPVIDRNPQKFVSSIYQAAATDYAPATQRIFCTPGMPSHLVLPLITPR